MNKEAIGGSHAPSANKPVEAAATSTAVLVSSTIIVSLRQKLLVDIKLPASLLLQL